MNVKKIYKIKRMEKNILVTAPWNNTFNYFVKSRNGSWDSSKKGWRVHKEHEIEIEKILFDIFGDADGLIVEITISKYKVINNLVLFNRELFVLNYFSKSYVMHPSVSIVNGKFPKKWAIMDEYSSGSFTNYFERQIVIIFNHFILKNIRLKIYNVSVTDYNDIRTGKYKWIQSCKAL